ncbi:hypothetical protein ONZ51_g7180 [Trametes cubensis]|uniref:Uncharacterized protein n=1 Tax=Trametes cubensis TaxID=1111947 RepID=A0AAD7TQP0_9APHY|nr:hypothetical protein ONZ51_g7180 [Trametes cubensis]
MRFAAVYGLISGRGPDFAISGKVVVAFPTICPDIPTICRSHDWSRDRYNTAHDQFLAAYPALEAAAPGQNLDRRVPSKGAVVVDYDLTHVGLSASAVVRDQSGNGYDARLLGGVLHTPLGSKGHNYTLLLRAKLGGSPGTLLAGPDDSFGLAALPEGGLTLAFTSSNITYLLSNFTLGPDTGATREIVLTGTESGTSAFVDGRLGYAGDFQTSIDQTGNNLAPMAFVAPAETVGAKGVQVERFMIWDGVRSVE